MPLSRLWFLRFLILQVQVGSRNVQVPQVCSVILLEVHSSPLWEARLDVREERCTCFLRKQWLGKKRKINIMGEWQGHCIEQCQNHDRSKFIVFSKRHASSLASLKNTSWAHSLEMPPLAYMKPSYVGGIILDFILYSIDISIIHLPIQS